MAYQPIENYGVIGDLQTVALVGMDGSIDYLCLPHLDSPTVFAALLDDANGGRFSIAPQLHDARHRQIYLPDSNMLLTRFLAEGGVAEISDFMPISDDRRHVLVRRAKTVRGEVRYRVTCAPRFDYARCGHRVEAEPGGVRFLPERSGLPALRLRADVPLRIENGAAVAEFTLGAGRNAAFVLEDIASGDGTPADAPDYVVTAFKDTMNFWHAWVARSSYRGRWREMVTRSALALKLLTSRAYGSIAAAGTFGLPEEIGGERNWDYRYTWIRDASFSLYALMRLGYTEEAAAFMRWIEERTHGEGPEGPLQIMYGLDGRRDLTETELPHLEGYRRSAPVRIGNGAHRQLQLDIYGELMDSVYLYDKHGQPISIDQWAHMVRVIDWVCDHWRDEDEGIWETRGGRRAFLYSRMMCWVAVDRGLRLAQRRSLPHPFDRWIAVRDTIYREILERFWDPRLQAFVQHLGGATLDASTLLMPLVRFLSPVDPRWLDTLDAIERRLVDDSLVYRYRVEASPDGLDGREGTFNMCSFWYAECLSRAGDLHQSRLVFEKMLGYANHLGLYSEELGPCGEHLGNFPQAFTHLALISAAFDLDRRLTESRIEA